MLISFSVSNFMSIKDEQTLDMRANTPPKQLLKQHVFKAKEHKLLPVVAIYGPNASGKSNFLMALNWFARYVNNNRDSDTMPYSPFVLDKGCKDQPMKFKVEYSMAPYTYSYEVHLRQDEVVFEQLFCDGELLYVRYNQDIDTKQTSLNDDITYFSEKETPEKGELFLSFFRTSKNEKLQFSFLFFRLFEKVRTGLPLQRTSVGRNLSKSPEKRAWLAESLRQFDTGIVGLHYDEGKDEFFGVHEDKDGDEVPIPWHRESEGTQALLFYLATKLFTERDETGILVIDEFESTLHPDAVHHLLETYLTRIDPKNNTKQIIFSTHNTLLMDRSLLRPDEIWLMEKFRGESRLCRLSHYDGVWQDKNWSKSYREGRYGTVPYLDDLPYLKEPN